MERITICGNSGSGKSTLAVELGQILRLPVFHLDKIQFRPGWQLLPEPEFLQQQDEWLAQPRWIIEGVAHWQGLVKRFEAADTIIYLDFPEALCQERAQQRLAEDRHLPSPFLPPNCPYEAKAQQQQEVIRFFQWEWRPKILNLMYSLRSGRDLYQIRTEEKLEQLLDTLRLQVQLHNPGVSACS